MFSGKETGIEDERIIRRIVKKMPKQHSSGAAAAQSSNICSEFTVIMRGVVHM